MQRDDTGVFQKPAEPYDPRGRLDPEGFAANVSFRTIAPPPQLTPFVEHGWSVSWERPAESYESPELMHRPYVDLFVSADEAGVHGTFKGKRTYLAAGSGRVVGVRLLPGALRAFWSGDMAALQDRVVNLGEIFAEADTQFVAGIASLESEAAVDRLFDLLIARKSAPDPNIGLLNAIIRKIEADERLATVATVAASTGKSERWLQNLFRSYVGVGLKWLLTRQRMLAAARHIRETAEIDWAGMAYDFGYSSQQHFITDFTTVLGMTPVRYRAWVGRG